MSSRAVYGCVSHGLAPSAVILVSRTEGRTQTFPHVSVCVCCINNGFVPSPRDSPRLAVGCSSPDHTTKTPCCMRGGERPQQGTRTEKYVYYHAGVSLAAVAYVVLSLVAERESVSRLVTEPQ